MIFLCFSAESKIMYILLVYIFLSTKTNSAHYIVYGVFVCISTATFKDTKLPLPKSRKHQKLEQYQGSTKCGDLDLNSDVNRPVSVKLRKSTTVSSQCEKFS